MKRPTPTWLSGAVIYELYPQSFLDTNADGIGDLPGVIRKLDYIQSLGCNTIWLNPCFESPFGDAGYDVSDFYRVAPRYGTNADLKRLFREARKRGLHVVLDLVAGHTSVEHPWFKASARAQKNKYSNWYIWTDSVWNEAGGSLRSISGCSERNGSYVINFFAFQPALNYGFANPDPDKPWQLPCDHPDVLALREEIKKIMRYWLDLGADGFRVDMASSIVKNDPDFKETSRFWREVREMYDREYPDAVLISEWSDPSRAIAAGFHADYLIHFNTLAYTSLFRYEDRSVFTSKPSEKNSFFDRRGKGNIGEFLETYLKDYKATRELGYISIPSGNHDISRLAMGRSAEELAVAFAFLLTMPGIPTIYNGDEIGMDYVKGLPSKEGGFGRTGSRTPMQWSDKKNAGFSTAPPHILYLPIDPDTERPTVEKQESIPGSLLHLIRQLTGLRKAIPALHEDGDFEVIFANQETYPFVYLRSAGNERILVALNPSERLIRQNLKPSIRLDQPQKIAGEGTSLSIRRGKWELVMEPVSFALFRC